MSASRLGEPVRKRAAEGISRFSRPIVPPAPPEAEEPPVIHDDVLTSKHQNIEVAPAPPPVIERPKKPPMRKKIGTTIRLTPLAVERLAQLEIGARREGVRGRASSASEIVETLIMTAQLSGLVPLLKEIP